MVGVEASMVMIRVSLIGSGAHFSVCICGIGHQNKDYPKMTSRAITVCTCDDVSVKVDEGEWNSC